MAKVEGLGFEITELRLGLPGGEGPAAKTSEKKRVFSQVSGEKNGSACGGDGPKMDQTKSQVVGWPPVCSYRRKNSFGEKAGEVAVSKMYVKVSMDGAPFLRKIDLGMHKEYSDLVVALEKLFGCFGIGKALKDADGSDYITIYEDKEGDWMLVGDVPWEMFMDSCKRLRIMKRSEAKGFNLQPRVPLKNLPSEDRG